MQPTPRDWQRRLRPIIEAHGPTPAPHRPPRIHERRLRRAAERLADAAEGLDPDAHGVRLDALARRWAEAGLPDDDEQIERFEIEQAEARELSEAAEADKPAVRGRHARRRVVETHGRVELRGLQTTTRVRVDLSAVFVALRAYDPRPLPADALADALPDDLPADSPLALLKDLPLRRPAPVPELVAALPRLLLTGGPGAGKSTLVAHLACADAATERLPIVVLARALTAPRFDVALLAETAGLPAADITQTLERGAARIYLDGLDELRPALRAPVTDAVAAFAAAWPTVPVVLTSRPRADATACPWPAGFDEAQVAALDDDQIKQCIHRWCAAAERSVQADPDAADAAAERTAGELMQAIGGSAAIRALAETPLMCTVLCIVHRFSARIPQRRVALYEACTAVLLFEWDRAKFPADAAIGRLDAAALRQLLGALARRMMESGEVEVSRAEVEAAFADRLPALGQPADDAARLVDEIRDRSGVLVQRSEGRYGFSHLAFQEYLCALEIVRAGDYAGLIARVDDEAWTEVFPLAAGLPTGDAAGIVEALIASEGDDTPGHATLLAATCVESAVQMPVRLREAVKGRVEALFAQGGDAALVSASGMLATLSPILAATIRALITRADVPDQRLIRLSTLLSLAPLGAALSSMVSLANDRRIATERPTVAMSIKLHMVSLMMDAGQDAEALLRPALAKVEPKAVNAFFETARHLSQLRAEMSSPPAPTPDAPPD